MPLPRILILVGALVACGLTAPSSASAEQDRGPSAEPLTIEAMTFNIRTAEGRDGDDAWPFRRELVAETIGRSDPDIVGLQEVLAEQSSFLEKALPQYRWLGVDRGLNGGQGLSEATPIFYKHAELLAIESGTFWLGNPPPSGGARRGGSRIVTWAHFHHIATGQQIYVFNTHFTLREGDTQLESAARINERVAALPPGSAVIVMGDFNAPAGSSQTWKVATSGRLRDAWDVADERHGPTVTSNGFEPPPEWGGLRIDWILVGGPVEVPKIATVVHSVGGRWPSDHYPVVATLRVRSR